MREITRKIDEQINSVRRELANLLNIGIITSDTTNNKLYYEVNQSFEHYAALSSMFGGKTFKPKKTPKTAKTNEVAPSTPEPVVEAVVEVAVTDPFALELLKTGNISLALYTGQFTRDETPGVDVVIVGDVNHAAVEHAIADLETSEKKELRYSIFSTDEFKYRKQVNDRFISNLLASKNIVLIDKDKLL